MISFDPNAIDIYTDGSVYPKNPGSGGFGIIVEFPECFDGERLTFKKSFKRTTNNRMELRACIDALKLVQKEQGYWRKKAGMIRIITDSDYVYKHKDNATNWRKNGWANKDGKPILNSDLWSEFTTLKSKTFAEIRWTKGKKSQILMDVDKLAKEAVEYPIKYPDTGYIEGNVSRAKIPKRAAQIYPADNQEEIIRVYRYIPIKNQYIIKFELFDFEENVYTDKYFAYASTEQKKELIHRHHWYKVKFNANSKYPKFDKIENWINSNE